MQSANKFCLGALSLTSWMHLNISPGSFLEEEIVLIHQISGFLHSTSLFSSYCFCNATIATDVLVKVFRSLPLGPFLLSFMLLFTPTA